MPLERQDLLSYFGTKKMFSQDELRQKIVELEAKIPSGVKKYVATDVIKKYDVLYLPGFGMHHYVLVHKVTESSVQGIMLTTKEAEHNIHQIEKDRGFRGSYATNTYISCKLEDALAKFVAVFENKAEADLIFKKVKDFYKSTLSL